MRISLPLLGKSPPSCGDVSPTTVSPENDVAVNVPVTVVPNLWFQTRNYYEIIHNFHLLENELMLHQCIYQS